MTWRIRLAPIAEAEIAQVLRRTEQDFGVSQHDAYLQLIVEALQRLSADPLAFPSKELSELHPNARSIHIAQRDRRARHRFIYRVHPDGTIEVARFLHDAMDLTKHRPDDWET